MCLRNKKPTQPGGFQRERVRGKLVRYGLKSYNGARCYGPSTPCQGFFSFSQEEGEQQKGWIELQKILSFKFRQYCWENRGRPTVPGNLVDWMVVLGVEQRVGLDESSVCCVKTRMKVTSIEAGEVISSPL